MSMNQQNGQGILSKVAMVLLLNSIEDKLGHFFLCY